MATVKTEAKQAKSAKLKTGVTDEPEIEMVTDDAVVANVIDPNLIKKKEIYDHVSVSTGLRKRDVREAVDSMLEYLHECLSNGKNIQMPPLGKIKAVERGSGENIKVHYKLMLKKPADVEKKAV